MEGSFCRSSKTPPTLAPCTGSAVQHGRAQGCSAEGLQHCRTDGGRHLGQPQPAAQLDALQGEAGPGRGGEGGGGGEKKKILLSGASSAEKKTQPQNLLAMHTKAASPDTFSWE